MKTKLKKTEQISQIPSRTTQFSRSFFPSTIKMWNGLSLSLQTTTNMGLFKQTVLPKVVPNLLFGIGTRKVNVLWSRIRMGCSALKGHLFQMHVIDDPRCVCGYDIEDALHYFMQCPLYLRQREILFLRCQSLDISLSIDVALKGSKSLSHADNVILVNHVFDYICDTGRFEV